MKKYICQFKKIDPTTGYSNGLKTILTTKVLREATHCSLKQAKNVVDGKLALMRAADVLDFIDLHCEVSQGATMSAVPQLGFEYTVVSSPVQHPPEPTGYFFVVHRES